MITIAKGTLPLAIFGPHGFGLRSGVLSAPARITQSTAPFRFGLLLDRMGAGAVMLSGGLMLAGFASLFLLRREYRPRLKSLPGLVHLDGGLRRRSDVPYHGDIRQNFGAGTADVRGHLWCACAARRVYRPALCPAAAMAGRVCPRLRRGWFAARVLCGRNGRLPNAGRPVRGAFWRAADPGARHRARCHRLSRRRGELRFFHVGRGFDHRRMGFLTFLPFLLKLKGADLPTIGLALTLIFTGGAAGKLACGWLGSRLGVVRATWVTEGLTAAGILAILPLPLFAALAVLPLVGIALTGTSSVLHGTVPELVAPERRQ